MEQEGKDPVAIAIEAYVQEAREAKTRRMQMNKENFDCYHLMGDWSHKQKGQSQEFLGKQQMAVEQITSFLQQGLVDTKEWFDIEFEKANPAPTWMDEKELKKIVARQLEKVDMPAFMADSVKLGLLGSLMICKVHGQETKRSMFETEKTINDQARPVKLIRNDKYYWGLNLSLVRQEDYFPDPTGSGLYEIEAIDIDYFSLLKIAERSPDVYDVEVVRGLLDNGSTEEDQKKSRETNQSTPTGGFRKMIRIYECWGTILDPKTKLPLMENGVCAVTVDGKVIRRPQDNPNWHNESPYVVAPIVRVPKSVWHRALMDAPTKHNKAQNELYNLMVDGGLMSVFGIKQLKLRYLDDPSQIANGIPPGTTLLANSSMPPGERLMERVDTGTLGREAFDVFSLIDREFQSSSLTNDTRMGNLPQRAVKATEIVASNQSITGIFNGIVSLIETRYLKEVLRKATLLTAQNINEINVSDLKDLLGNDKAAIVSGLEPEEVFAKIANGVKFKVFGLSTVMNRINDFRKITSLLQTIGASPELVKNFQAKYSFTKLLGEIVKALDINEDRIMLDDEEKARLAQEQAFQQKLQMTMAQQGGKPQPGKDKMSQVADAGQMSPETGTPDMQGEMQQGASTGEVM